MRRATIGVLLIVTGLLFAEVFIRVFHPEPVIPRYTTGTAWGVRGNIPNAHYWHHMPEVDVEYRINAQGLRADVNYSLRKRVGTCRIGLFGDSDFFGYEVAMKDTFGVQLEERLRLRGVSVEVMNFAVPGFGTGEMLRTYEQFGRLFDPDLVIFSWDISDLDDNVRADLYRLTEGQLTRAEPEYLPGVKMQDFLMQHRFYRFVADHSELYSFARERINELLKQRLVRANMAGLGSVQGRDFDAAPAQDDDVDEIQHRNKIDLSAALLLHAREEIVSDDREFYLVDFPVARSPVEFASTMGLLPRLVGSRITIISPIDSLAGAARTGLKLYYARGLGHLAPAGLTVLAEESAGALAASSRLAKCRAQPRPPAQ